MAASVNLPEAALDDRPVKNPAIAGRRPIGVLRIPATIKQWLRRAYGLGKLLTAPRQARELRDARAGSALARHVAMYARRSALAGQPFLSAGWSSRLRMQRMIDHCAIIDRLGPPFDVACREFVEIIAFDLAGHACRLSLDKPSWMSCDGMVVASLWVDIDRVFSISFCLSDTGGARTAYVGGIQGRRDSNTLELYRALTKAAHGMRPRDLAFDLFRMLLPHCHATELRCVADTHRYQKTGRAILTIGKEDKVLLDYNEIWEDRGGVPGGDGFYNVPVTPQRRDSGDIPAKKRSLYARRYTLLNELNRAVDAAMAGRVTTALHARERAALTARVDFTAATNCQPDESC